MTVDVGTLLLAAVVSLVIPALVALVAHAHAPAAVKAVASLLLSAANGVFVSAQTDLGFGWRTSILYAIYTFILATAVHFGFLKPAGVTGSDGVIARAIRGGVGAPRADIR